MYSPAPDRPAGFFSTWPSARPLTDRSPWWAHYTETRPTAPTRKLAPERRDKLVESAVDRMQQRLSHRRSVFGCEGPVRHKVRRDLCLEGWRWIDADAAAADIVERALTQLGAVRPTWQQGQPSWCQEGWDPVRYTRCVRCGEIIPDQRLGARDVKFCSTLCTGAEHQERARIHGQRVSMAEHMQRVAAKRQATEAIRLECEHCGASYQPAPGRWRVQKFCSVRCADLGKPKMQRTLAPKPCARCGELFQPRKAVSVFCGPACRHVRGFERQCPVCSTIFRVPTLYRPATCCSRHCAMILRRRGTHPPAKRKPPADEGDGQHKARRCA